ncbi:transposase [Streptomyces sp. b84]|uniref:transposase n=1 Tax=Streptomyces sp. b84 TaxID=1827631 RepID=UPI0035A15859
MLSVRQRTRGLSDGGFGSCAHRRASRAPTVPVSRPEKREDTVPADFAPDPAREPHDADNQAPAGDVDQVPQPPNVHDSLALKPMIAGHQTRRHAHGGRYFKPQRLHADKAYDVAHLRKWLRGKRIGVRTVRKGIESSERLGRRRRVIGRTMSWLTGCRRLDHRYERNPRNYLAFLGLAAAICRYKRLVRLTT